LRLAAIDIGSNAARLLISEATIAEQMKPDFVKLTLVRVPLRLGFDVFERGSISEQRADKFLKTIKSYKLLIDVYEVEHLITAATSAMRDASNAKEILENVEAETGIRINVISGQEEATYIYENHIADNLNVNESYLYIDVGGGSTELTFFSDGRLVAKQSFNIGTIRLLKNQVHEELWAEMKNFIKQNTGGYHHITAIGSGGNINKVFSLSKRKEGKPLPLELLRNYYKEFSSISLTQRTRLYHLREDRADVIVPALLIYINVMRWADTEEIFVPKIGLADGLIHILYDRVVKSTESAVF
jgi:exopolyphosphatase / guanosine-5'-triphosphate,3'-diphosphate pyrophosphatase